MKRQTNKRVTESPKRIRHLKRATLGGALGAAALLASGATGHAATAAPATPTPPAPPIDPGAAVGTSPTQRQFVLGDGATAVFDTINGQVIVVGLAAHPGWAVVGIERDDDGGLDIRMVSTAGAGAEFDVTTQWGGLGAVHDDCDGPLGGDDDDCWWDDDRWEGDDDDDDGGGGGGGGAGGGGGDDDDDGGGGGGGGGGDDDDGGGGGDDD